MSEVAAIAAALASLKTAIDIANAIRSSDVSLQSAEMKLKLADMLGSLADAKLQIIDLQEVLVQQEQRISELDEALDIQGDVVLRADAYFLADKTGPDAGPYCLRCWQVEHRLRRVVRGLGSMANCPACGSTYHRGLIGL